MVLIHVKNLIKHVNIISNNKCDSYEYGLHKNLDDTS